MGVPAGSLVHEKHDFAHSPRCLRTQQLSNILGILVLAAHGWQRHGPDGPAHNEP